MEKIDLIFIILAIGGVVSLVNVEFPSITGGVVSECIDSDSGKDPYTGGNLIGNDESVKRDTCIDGDKLYEYFCADGRSNGAIEVFDCFNGCVTENGKGHCLRKREEVKGDLKYGECDSGCYFRGVCIPVNTRTVDGTYCGVDRELKWQILGEESCNNNFECKSNLCIINKCISNEVFNKFLESISNPIQ
jgi:hypothetical protein